MKKNLLLTSIVAAVAVSLGVSAATYAMGGDDDFGGAFGFRPEMRGEMRGEFESGTGARMGMGKRHEKREGRGDERSEGNEGKGDFGPKGERGFGSQGEKPDMTDAMRTAIKNNDYNAFVKAWNEAQSNITVPIKEEFAKKVASFIAHQAVETALLANDYTAFTKAIANLPKPGTGDDKKPTLPTPATGDFVKMVVMAKYHQTLENAVLANDYKAFTTALANRPMPATGTDTRPTPSTPTTGEFAKMVDMAKKRQAVEATFKANDYTAFVAAWKANKPTVPTKEEFANIVAKKDEIKEDRKELKQDRKDLKSMIKGKLQGKKMKAKEKGNR